MQPWHLTISSTQRLTLFPSPAQLRSALHALVRVLGDELALFCIVDDHLHCVLVCDAATVEHRRRALTHSVRVHAAVEVSSTHVRPIESRAHMERVFAYLLRQPAKHGLPVHPALWEGGCFLDLVGARSLPGLHLRIGEALPRATQADAFAAVGLPARSLEPMPLERVRAIGAQRLIDAATASAAAEPGLRGHGARAVAARRAACRLARQARIPKSELAWLLGITPRAVDRLAAHPAGEPIALSTLRRLALEERVGERR
jgi:REP element-mobilizing transposase RayT